MSTVRFISDLHFGHSKILDFVGAARGGSTVDEHDQWLIEQWNSVVTKRDAVYVLGDVAFSRKGLACVKNLRGQKFLLLGNHDNFPLSDYEALGFKIIGFKKYKGFWLSHAPIHPQELRGKYNIHGHVHLNSVPDGRYFNVCVEPLQGKPISLTEIAAAMNLDQGKRKPSVDRPLRK